MASIFRECSVYAGGVRWDSKLTQVSFGVQTEMKDETTLGSSTREYLAGLSTISLSLAGYSDAAASDEWDLVSDADLQYLTIVPGGSNPAYICRGRLNTSPIVQGSIGDIRPLSLEGTGEETVLRGGSLGEITADGSNATGTGITLAALASGDQATANIHITELTGSGIKVEIQSAATGATGGGSWTKRMEVTAAVGGHRTTFSTATNHTLWRVRTTGVGSNESATVAAALHIG